MNILKQLDYITRKIEASHRRLAGKLGKKASWLIIKSCLEAYIASRDKLVERGII